MAKSNTKTGSKSKSEVKKPVAEKILNTKSKQTPVVAKASKKVAKPVVKAPSPSSSDSESASEDSDSSEEEKPVVKAKANGKAAPKKAEVASSSSDSDSSSDDSDSSDSDSGVKPVAAAAESEDSDSSEEESDEETAPVAAVAKKVVDAGKSAVNGAAKVVAKATVSLFSFFTTLESIANSITGEVRLRL